MWNCSSGSKAFYVLKLFYLHPRKSDTFASPKVLLLLINVWELSLPETELFQEIWHQFQSVSYKKHEYKEILQKLKRKSIFSFDSDMQFSHSLVPLIFTVHSK